ncbi:twin-arginine translocase TatA/TatE family subunit [Acidiphilium sp.]|uniref:twin-arginine translocase TatA/TatE family subunit n=1 Tax=Acidiphilium sp. TaxID=527 RepID=UPI003D0674B2
MGFDSPIHWIIVIGVIALLFGGSRVGNLMGELGKGIKAFKQNVADTDSNKAAPPPAAPPAPPVQARVADATPQPDPAVRQPEPVHGPDQTRL